MIFQSVEFIRLQLPFNSGFEHARTARAVGDTVLVKLSTDTGLHGWGEILPRPYVTGETVDNIFNEQSAEPQALAEALGASRINNQAQLEQWIDRALPQYQHHTALFGGVELAMWDVLNQTGGVDWDAALGPVNERETGRCVTIGFDADTDKLRARAIDAKFKKATVVKLKIDANGLFDTDRMTALLQACAGSTALQSVEQPFKHTDYSYAEIQRRLYSEFGIPFVADESVCSIEDAIRWQKSGGFQIYNLRIGKHGGMRATRIIRDLAQAAGIGLVSGSMVGETGILTQASELLLSRSSSFDYVEGLGQNRQFLAIDPVEAVTAENAPDNAGEAMQSFTLKAQAEAELLQERRTINC